MPYASVQNPKCDAKSPLHVISFVFLFVILIEKSVVLSWFGDFKCVLASQDFCQVIPRNLVSIVGCEFDMECFRNVDFEF